MDARRSSRNVPLASELPLFEGVAPGAVPHVLACLHAGYHFFECGETLFREGDRVAECLYIVAGTVQLITVDDQGRRSILCEYRAHDAIAAESLFGEESHAAADAVAVEPTTTLSMTITPEVARKARCMEHLRPVRHNLAKTLARTNRNLLERLFIASKRTTREKVLAYLRAQAVRAGDSTFSISLTRQELADYLYVERTALSHELSKLQAEGLVAYHRNRFTLPDEHPGGPLRP